MNTVISPRQPHLSPGLLDAVRARLIRDRVDPTPARVAAALRAEGGVLGDSELLSIVRVLRADLTGAGPLDPLLNNPGITDILVNGPDQVWVDDGGGLRRVPQIRFRDDGAVRRLAQRLAAQAGRRLDSAAPWVDARLPNGARLHAVLAPIAPEGTCVSLRLPRHRVFSMDELVSSGTLPAAGAHLLQAVVAAKAAFLVCGGTGSGKTTLLSALLSLTRHDERLLLVEDSAELRPEHPHVVRLQARPPNIEGTGGVDLHQLVRQALRMRPDRLVVGEVRGAEVVDLLAALNTGHEGGCGTLHANAAADVPARVEALGCAAGMSRQAVHSQLCATRALIIHLARFPDGVRRLTELHVLRRDANGLVHTVPAIEFPAEGGVRAHTGVTDLATRLAGLWAPPPGEG
ncbi:pilus assembly protein CpaF [Marinactinospora thermotolerans DSM 45154]|uniref:Pilus assembly protein CpaF n=1 Tax=Marinactinospora thermotolerans DSM 45154 TaxID=1122192 RepID=A0A1T4T219_9ACTN|nr:TadA family conjugal transfer-associated ATPase [Marinactinospora thermotolerans]SKA34560.1 pilus assembly protein CpaF [Marinactinospora thermotolerans DSM 45154]